MLPAFLSRLSLRWLLILNVIIPLLLAMAVASYFGLRALEHIAEEKMQEDVQLVARAIRLPVSYSLEKERFGSIRQAIESVFRIDRVYGAYVYDKDGELVVEAGSVESDKQQEDLRDVARDGERTGQYEKIQGRRVYSYFVPLFDSTGKSNGLLQITRKRSDFENYIQWLRARVAFILAGAGLFIAGFVLFGFQRAAGQHFSALTRSMSIIREGDRSHRAGTSGPREISTLANTFNAMLDSLDHSEKEIAKRREEQQALEYKLRQSEKMAAIGRLAAGVAHELGAPLSLIDGKAQRSLRDGGLDPAHQSSLQDIRTQVSRMNDIVRQLLDFGKGTMRPRHWTRAGHIAGSALAAVRREVDQSLWFTAEGPQPGPFIYVDPLSFEQALINLLRNASQSAETSRVRLSWDLSENNEVCFSVEDDGPGIPEELKSKIFEPFFSTHQDLSNTGMGLSIVHGTVNEHEGGITVFDSALGGAGFRITLPPVDGEQNNDKGKQNV
ncbi:MAG: ATP-binding protein [Desulfosudaceae bacterium]